MIMMMIIIIIIIIIIIMYCNNFIGRHRVLVGPKLSEPPRHPDYRGTIVLLLLLLLSSVLKKLELPTPGLSLYCGGPFAVKYMLYSEIFYITKPRI
jgi:hypothetical protein